MSNNSVHVRFRNTLVDMQDCVDAIESLINGEDTNGELTQPLSPEELVAARLLMESAACLLTVVSEEVDVDASDILDFDSKRSRQVDELLTRLNEEARNALIDEAAEEEDEDEDEDEDDDADIDDLDEEDEE